MSNKVFVVTYILALSLKADSYYKKLLNAESINKLRSICIVTFDVSIFSEPSSSCNWGKVAFFYFSVILCLLKSQIESNNSISSVYVASL